MELNSKFRLFATNFLVAGKTRSLVVDTSRQCLYPIPNSLRELILEHDGKQTIAEIIDFYGTSARETLLEYFEFLLQKEIIFLTNEPEYFPDVDTSWDFPSHITNAIIDFNPELMEYYEKFIQELDALLCNYVEIRLFEPFSKMDLNRLLTFFDEKIVLDIRLLINFEAGLRREDFKKLLLTYPRISNISVYNTDLENTEVTDRKIFYFKNEIGNHSCGQINKTYFTPNMRGVTEALQFNSCLNRKIAVDAKGDIKNCPSMSKSFGKIKDTSIQAVSKDPDFQKVWSINKDKIHVCKDCEFRYVCTDCRAFVDDPEDIFSKPLKCGYNPYTGEWSNWSDNPLKQKAIEHYGLKTLTVSE